MTESDAARARRLAMHLLARREHSAQELSAKLHQRLKGVDVAVIEGEIARLTAAGLQSDQRFADNFSRARVGRGYGPQRIVRELQQRGADVEKLADLSDSTHDWRARALDLLQRRYAGKSLREPSERAKAMAYLYRRGYSGDVVRRTIETFLATQGQPIEEDL